MLNPNEKLKSLARDGGDENLIQVFYVIMKTFGYTLEELQALPIPTFNLLLKMIQKENEQKRRANKRR